MTLQHKVAQAPHEALPYTVYSHSSYSGPYHPRNICVNDPTEQSSRWSSGSHDQSQYITLKLEKPAVVCEILFGKFQRSHVCNLKEFKVYGGLDPQDMKELLHTGLTDDSKTETFDIRYTYNDLIFPIQYVKVCPIATFGANFNYSIWYIELRGIKDLGLMSQVYEAYDNYKEMETIRLCLKHFRQKNMMDVFVTLQKKSNIQLEDPLITRLHQALVLEGNFDEAESIIDEGNSQHVFQSYAEDAKYLPIWQRIYATNDDGDAPCARGGHQLCLDAYNEKIYLFGGWDGKRELSDFWYYHIKEKRWKLLSQDTSKQGGPSPLSCHTMCFDPVRKSIYVLGRYIESKSTTASTESKPIPESEFYQYFTELDRWIKISENTEIDGGPPLLFDHQMCVDPVSRTLFVLGGRVITNETANSPHTYSGFYAYNMDECVWHILRHDISAPTASTTTSSTTPTTTQLLAVNDIPIDRRRSSNGSYVFLQHQNPNTTIKSRAGHTLLLDSTHRRLYIFGGHRFKESLTDLLCYHLDTDTLQEIAHDFIDSKVTDEVAHTQRAAIDTTRQELVVTLGYLCNNNNVTMTRTCGWVYRIQQNTWEKVFELDNHNNGPCARYTHQWVFNPKSKSNFMFGGNPGDEIAPTKRLDDLWELKLKKPDTAQVVRKCKYLLRSRQLVELCKLADDGDNTDKGVSQATQRALDYLRNYVAPIVDQENTQETDEFRCLCTQVCLCLDALDKHQQPEDQGAYFSDRTSVFQALLAFFPKHLKEPEGTLADAVKIA